MVRRSTLIERRRQFGSVVVEDGVLEGEYLRLVRFVDSGAVGPAEAERAGVHTAGEQDYLAVAGAGGLQERLVEEVRAHGDLLADELEQVRP